MAASPDPTETPRGAAGSIWMQSAAMIAAIVAVGLVALPVAWWISGSLGVIAASTAAAICLIGALLAVALGHLLPAGPQAPLQRMLVGMMARTALPLIAGVTLHFEVPSLAEAGMVFYLFVFYIASLATETALVIREASLGDATRKPR